MSPDYTNFDPSPDDWMKGEPGQAYQPRGGLPMTFFADIAPVLEGNDFVEGLVTTSSFVVVYGEPGSGKTFWVLDLCLHIAAGRTWNGREVEGGPVVYVALEGGNGIRNRIEAARRRMGLPPETPFALIQCPIDLRTADADTNKLIVSINEVARTFGQPVRLVVIDTLFRALAGGNENAAEDMGTLVRNADLIRDQTKTCVLFIHHCGKEVARGMRGHSSLKAATDTEIEVTRPTEDDTLSVARVTRQRDMETTGSFAFHLDSEILGEDQRGKPVRSCVVSTSEAPPTASTKGRALSEEAIDLHQHITVLIAASGETGSPAQDVRDVRMLARKQLHPALADCGWLVSTRVSDKSEEEKVPRSEYTRLHKRLIPARRTVDSKVNRRGAQRCDSWPPSEWRRL
jgi:RecA/RadA recombinase